MAPSLAVPDGRQLDASAIPAALRRIGSASSPPWLHGEAARRLAERLLPLRDEPRRVLDWWAGVGGGGAVLRERYPHADIVAVEAPGWAPRRPAAPARRRWLLPWRNDTAAPAVSSTTDDAAIGSASLVWANMMLHFVADPPALFARWHGLLEVGGVVAFSCLGPGSLRSLRELYASLGWPAPTPGFIDMHDLGDMLVGAGFAEPVLEQETLTLRWADAAALLAELEQLGGNTAPGRFAGLRTPRWRQRLLAALAERAGADGRIGLDFEVAYGHGFKPSPRPAPGEPVSLPLATVRAQLRRPRPPHAERVR